MAKYAKKCQIETDKLTLEKRDLKTTTFKRRIMLLELIVCKNVYAINQEYGLQFTTHLWLFLETMTLTVWLKNNQVQKQTDF